MSIGSERQPQCGATGGDDFKLFFSASPAALLVADLQGRIIDLNPSLATLLGFETACQALSAVSNLSALFPHDTDAGRALIRHALEGTAPPALMMRRADGAETEVAIDLAIAARDDQPQDRAGARSPALLGVIRAHTPGEATALELRRALDAARQENLAKTNFLASMSHELRTPLNAIMGFAEILSCELFGPLGNPRYRGYARDIQFGAHHLLGIIEDILAFAKVEAGHAELIEEDINVRGAVDAAVRIVSELARRAQVEIINRVPANLPVLRGDRRRIEQILINLLNNAVEFSPPGESVSIAAIASLDGAIAISVADNGPGMTEEEAKRATEPFVQIENHPHVSRRGTGLGLAVCRTLAELHGGALRLQGTPGKGTVATIVFPPQRCHAGGAEPAQLSG